MNTRIPLGVRRNGTIVFDDDPDLETMVRGVDFVTGGAMTLSYMAHVEEIYAHHPLEGTVPIVPRSRV